MITKVVQAPQTKHRHYSRREYFGGQAQETGNNNDVTGAVRSQLITKEHLFLKARDLEESSFSSLLLQ
eukprot:2417902-Amphidinium_carterae.1